MIKSKNDLREYIKIDMKASQKKDSWLLRFKDEAWNYQVTLRKYEYYLNTGNKIMSWIYKCIHHFQGAKLGIMIGPNQFGKGLWIPHPYGIIVNPKAKIGDYCIIHQGVTIGNNGKIDEAPLIGDNAFIGANAVIIGPITIGNNVTIGALSLVNRSFGDNEILIGIPARSKL